MLRGNMYIIASLYMLLSILNRKSTPKQNRINRYMEIMKQHKGSSC